MSFCPNCGTPLNGDEKFCSKCGATITNDVQASSSTEAASTINAPNSNAQYAYNQQIVINNPGPSPLALAFGEIKKELFTFFKSPVDYVSSLKNELSKLATMLFCSITAFLLIMDCFWNGMHTKGILFDSSSDLSKNSLQDILKSADLSSILFGGGYKASKVPNAGIIFLISLVYIVLLLALVWGVTLLVNKLILNSQSSSLYVLNKVLFSIIPVVIFSYLATILSYADGTIGSVFNILGLFLTSILLFKTLNNNTAKSENITLYLFLIFPVALIIFNSIFFSIVGPDYSSLFGSVIFSRH